MPFDKSRKKIPPLRSIDGYRNVPIFECGEVLIKLSEDKNLRLAYTYFEKDLQGAKPSCFVRKEVAKMLLNACRNLPDGYFLVVNDGWRPYNVQLEIYKGMFESVMKLHPNFTEEEVHAEASKYASSGSLDPKMPSPHFTGGAVDVTLADEGGSEYSMGSEFDESIIESRTRFFEEKLENEIELTKIEQEAVTNRRILFHCMIESGFTNYSNEWWHFDYGNQLWAIIKDTNAIYGLTKP